MKEKDLPAGWVTALKAMQPGETEMITMDDGQEFLIVRREDLEAAGANIRRDWLKKFGISTK